MFPCRNCSACFYLELYDCSQPRTDSPGKTGISVNVNEEDIALIRYGDDLYAIAEKCPHAGK